MSQCKLNTKLTNMSFEVGIVAIFMSMVEWKRPSRYEFFHLKISKEASVWCNLSYFLIDCSILSFFFTAVPILKLIMALMELLPYWLGPLVDFFLNMKYLFISISRSHSNKPGTKPSWTWYRWGDWLSLLVELAREVRVWWIYWVGV